MRRRWCTRSPFLPLKRLLLPLPASVNVLSRAQHNFNLLPVQHCCTETTPSLPQSTGNSSSLPCRNSSGTYWLRLRVKELTGATVSPSWWLPSAAREARSKLLCRQRPEDPPTPSFPIPAMPMPGGCRRPWPAAKGCGPWRSGAAAGAVGSSTAGPAGMPWQDLPSAAISCCGGESAHQRRDPRCATRRPCPKSPARNRVRPQRSPGPSRARGCGRRYSPGPSRSFAAIG